jgi:hypothetical protein
MRDYWRHCGYGLLARTGEGRLQVTDDFLRSLLERPELAPLPESCAHELALHERLQAHPRAAVEKRELQQIADDSARSNYAIWLRFRDRALAQPTLEACYVALFRGEGVDVPPLFVQQLTQVLLRHVVGDEATAWEARAAEMLFRHQRIALHEGQVVAADAETVDRHATAAPPGAIAELLRQAGAPLRSAELDVMADADADVYWERDEAHDLAVRLGPEEPVVVALCRVLERWIAHFTGTPVRIEPRRAIDDDQWVWHVGLDAQATALLNDLYRGHPVNEDRMKRLLGLFSLTFGEPAAMRPEIAGRPVYLAMAMDEEQRLKLKPQNLLLNLPLARAV